MQFNPGFSSLAALLADPGRAQMIWALMDGSARPASELALLAGVSPSSASGHLGRGYYSVRNFLMLKPLA